MSAAQLAVIDMALDGLGGEWVRARHGGYTECSECAGTEPHEQGAVRFEHPRDLDAIEEALPGFVVAPLTGRLAFPKYVAYLTHGGFHELYSNFDWRKVVAGRPATKPPTLKAVRRQVFDGELSPVEVGERWPDLYLRHARALEVDWTRGQEHRKRAAFEEQERELAAVRKRREEERRVEWAQRAAKVAAQGAREAEQRGLGCGEGREWLLTDEGLAWLKSPPGLWWRDTPDGRVFAEDCTVWLDARHEWKISPAYQEYLTRVAAEQQRERDEEHERAERARRAQEERTWESTGTRWYVDYIAYAAGLCGDRRAREAQVAERVGELSKAALLVWIADYEECDAIQAEIEVRQFCTDIESDNSKGGQRGAARHAALDGNANGFRLLQRVKAEAARWPGLVQFHRDALPPRHEWREKAQFDELTAPIAQGGAK